MMVTNDMFYASTTSHHFNFNPQKGQLIERSNKLKEARDEREVCTIDEGRPAINPPDINEVWRTIRFNTNNRFVDSSSMD
jgi:hypothetical protein